VVYTRRLEPPSFPAFDLGERGRWIAVFSTLRRLAAHTGEGHYLATAGADLLTSLPRGVSRVGDPADQH